MISIIKKSGEEAEFDASKLKSSLIRSGASEKDADFVTNYIVNNITDGMSTHKVYGLAYSMLKKKSAKVAGKYRLKKAIFDLGPTGFPFELLVGELIKLQKFNVTTGIVLDGNCVTHEVDVFAEKPNKTVFVECKFHNDARRKSDVKVSLYVFSRYNDLKTKFAKEHESTHNFEGWVVTNTRFTSDAIDFGTCAGLKMISWDYPAQGNLRQLIDTSGFHPITSIQKLKKREKVFLLENDVVLCRQIPGKADLLRKFGVPENRIVQILKEAKQISELV